MGMDAQGPGMNGLQNMTGMQPQQDQTTVQNVTPVNPVVTGNGLQNAQSQGKGMYGPQQSSVPTQNTPNQWSGVSTAKGGHSAPTLMSAQPPGQAQNTVTSGQPIMGQPNQYMNTIGQNQQPFSYAQPHFGGKTGGSSGTGSPNSGGKGKG